MVSGLPKNRPVANRAGSGEPTGQTIIQVRLRTQARLSILYTTTLDYTHGNSRPGRKIMETVGQQLLTMLRAQHPDASLYSLHHILGCSHQTVYQIADGTQEMGADTVLITCDCLGIDPRPWLIQVELHRCKSPKRRQILTKILADLEPAITRAVVGFLAVFTVGFFGVF